jgi:hypothetical protein
VAEVVEVLPAGMLEEMGGSGVVILSVPTAYQVQQQEAPTMTTSGSNTIIKWTTGSGTYTA